MRPSEILNRRREDARAAVARWRVANPRIFGSVARGDDNESSDLDILVDKTDETKFRDLLGVEDDLSALLGIRVDVVTTNTLPPTIKSQIIRESLPL